MWCAVDIETFKKYDGTKECEEIILKGTADEKDKKWFKKNKKKGNYYPVLNSQEFVLGAVLRDDGDLKYFYKGEELWNYLDALIRKNAKNGEMTYIYGHHLSYDWNGFARDKYFEEHLENVCDYPFLVTFNCEGKKGYKNWGWFVDTMGFYPRALAEIGNEIGFEKLEMPPTIKKIDV